MGLVKQRLKRCHSHTTANRLHSAAFWILLFILAWLGLSCASALADGAVFAEPHYIAKIEIPNQQAYIRFANNTERLVIETSNPDNRLKAPK